MAYRVFLDFAEDGSVVDDAGKAWRFEFSEYGGPLVLGRNGDPLRKQPPERSPFWPAFAVWLAARKKEKEKEKKASPRKDGEVAKG